MDYIFKKRNVCGFIFLLLYKLVLDFVYVKFVYELYNYSGFVYEFNLDKCLLSILYFILVYLALPKDSRKPSSVFLQVHFIVMIMPMFTLYSFANESGKFMVLCCAFFMMECIMLRVLPSIKIIKIKNANEMLKWIIILLSLFVYTSMLKANGLPSFKALDFTKVYDIRRSVKYPFLMSYLVNWQAKVINPFLISTSYIKNNKKVFIVSILMQLLIYLITAHKSFLFIPFAIIITMEMLKRKEFLIVGSFFAPIGVIISYLTYYIFENLMMPSLFIRRFLFVPAQLRFNYYDFFSKNEFLYFSEGLLGKITGRKSIYGINIANLIGYLYGGNINTWANTGYLADAYANMGVFGMLIISLLFTFILMKIDSLGSKINKELVIGLSLPSILLLNDGALFTSLLTGGLLLLLIILHLYSNTEQIEVHKSRKNV